MNKTLYNDTLDVCFSGAHYIHTLIKSQVLMSVRQDLLDQYHRMTHYIIAFPATRSSMSEAILQTETQKETISGWFSQPTQLQVV